MKSNPFHHEVLLQLGPVGVTRPVVTTWMVMAVLALAGWWVTRRLSVDRPGRLQILAELLMTTLRDEMRSTMRLDPEPFLPVVATLFLFILGANLSSLVPGVEPPTGALETDLALALGGLAEDRLQTSPGIELRPNRADALPVSRAVDRMLQIRPRFRLS